MLAQRFAILLSLVASLLVSVSSQAQVTREPWREAIVSVTDIERTALFFAELGHYVTLNQGLLSRSELNAWGLPQTATGEYRLIGPAGESSGLIRLIDFDNAGPQIPMRPGARAWDTGCYFSLMVRVKGLEDLYSRAVELGWWTETPIAPLQFGDSDLRIVIFKGPDGLQVQSYERLSPALPGAVGDFTRMTRPFNIMQMVASHADAYRFFTQVLGFETFYTGPPVKSVEPVLSPIGIPWSMTPEVGYQAGIVYPQPGEYGRIEMIQLHGLAGQDYRSRCVAPNLGILAVRFPASDLDRIASVLDDSNTDYTVSESVDLADLGWVDLLSTQSPDGAIIQFYHPVNP